MSLIERARAALRAGRQPPPSLVNVIQSAEAAALNARAALLEVQAARASCPLEKERLSASAALLILRSSRIAGVPSTSMPALQESSDASA